MGLIELKSDEALNQWVNEMAVTVNKINEEAVSKGDVDLVKKENADLKALLEVNKVEMANIKDLMKNRFHEKSADEKTYDTGRFIYAVRHNNSKLINEMGGANQLNPNSEDDWRSGTEWNINAATDLGTPLRGDATTGSYLVPEIIAAEILRIPEDPSALMGQVRTMPMNVRKISFPRKLTGAEFTWVTNEITAKTETNPTFDNVDLECETAAAWIAFTDEMREDSLVDLGSYFTDLYREAWVTAFDTQCLNSDSAPFTGVLQNTGCNVLSMGAGMSAFENVKINDLLNLVAKLTTQAKRNGSKFIMHTTILDIFKKLKNDDGDYIWQAPAGTTPGTIAGYGYILSDAMPDATQSAASTAFVAFGNPKNIIHGNRVGMEFKLFDQTSDGMVYDRLFIRARLRQAFVTGTPDGFAVLKTSS